MAKSAARGQFTPETEATPSRTHEPAVPSVSRLRTYAWWVVLGLVGLDCFSTLGYLPTIAVEGEAGVMAPLAAVAVALLILFAALPVYLYVIGRSSQGTGATGLLETHLAGWKGKLFILLLLGFVATDFVMTRTLSTADATKHLLDNPYAESGLEWMQDRKDAVQEALPEWLKGTWTDQFFDWWNGQLMVTVLLTILGFALYYFLLRGFTRGFVYAAAAIVALFLFVNGVVLVSSLLYISRHPLYMTNWWDLVTSTSQDKPLPDFLLDLVILAVQSLPALALGLSGFELSMTVAPLVRGRADDAPSQPRGRIRNMRKLLVLTAVLMSLLVPASVITVQFLVPRGATGSEGKARHRALAYMAHGENLRAPGRRAGIRRPVNENVDPLAAEDAEMDAPDEEEKNPAGEMPLMPEATAAVKGSDVNPMFGAAFGTLYDISAVLILILAGASVTVSLRELLPQYLTRYGMEMHWAQRIGILLHLFNVVVLIVLIAFRASVSHQQAAYATSVLVLMAGAAFAAVVDLRSRWRRYFFRPLLTAPLVGIGVIFLSMACAVCYYENSTGILIALSLILVLFFSAGISRWQRSTELRYQGFAYADEDTGIRWELIRRLEFQVLVPHRPDHRTLAEKEAEIRARHRLTPDVPIIFVEAELGDPSDFQNHPLMQIVKVDDREVIRVSECASIAHVLAAIALEFREVGRPPEIHFAWSQESPLASNLHFLLFGQGNIPWMVHALIRKFEPDPARQPRVVIG